VQLTAGLPADPEATSPVSPGPEISPASSTGGQEAPPSVPDGVARVSLGRTQLQRLGSLLGIRPSASQSPTGETASGGTPENGAGSGKISVGKSPGVSLAKSAFQRLPAAARAHLNSIRVQITSLPNEPETTLKGPWEIRAKAAMATIAKSQNSKVKDINDKLKGKHPDNESTNRMVNLGRRIYGDSDELAVSNLKGMVLGGRLKPETATSLLKYYRSLVVWPDEEGTVLGKAPEIPEDYLDPDWDAPVLGFFDEEGDGVEFVGPQVPIGGKNTKVSLVKGKPSTGGNGPAGGTSIEGKVPVAGDKPTRLGTPPTGGASTEFSLEKLEGPLGEIEGV